MWKSMLFHTFNTGHCGSSLERCLELFERVFGTRGHDLHPSVREVGCPAGQTQGPGRSEGEPAISNALHSSADHPSH